MHVCPHLILQQADLYEVYLNYFGHRKSNLVQGNVYIYFSREVDVGVIRGNVHILVSLKIRLFLFVLIHLHVNNLPLQNVYQQVKHLGHFRYYILQHLRYSILMAV